jgi:hypothetical protein
MCKFHLFTFLICPNSTLRFHKLSVDDIEGRFVTFLSSIIELLTLSHIAQCSLVIGCCWATRLHVDLSVLLTEAKFFTLDLYSGIFYWMKKNLFFVCVEKNLKLDHETSFLWDKNKSLKLNSRHQTTLMFRLSSGWMNHRIKVRCEKILSIKFHRLN